MEQNKMDTIKSATSKIFTKQYIKQAAGVLTICAFIGSGGAYYLYQQKEVKEAAVRQARSELVTTEASRYNLTLLDQNKIRSLAAAAIGKDEASLTYSRIELKNLTAFDRKEDKHDKEEKGEKRDKGHKNIGEPGKQHRDQQIQQSHTEASVQHPQVVLEINAVPPQVVPNTNTIQQQIQTPSEAKKQAFYPVYTVSMKDGNVRYKVVLNALTGEVLLTKAG